MAPCFSDGIIIHHKMHNVNTFLKNNSLLLHFYAQRVKTPPFLCTLHKLLGLNGSFATLESGCPLSFARFFCAKSSRGKCIILNLFAHFHLKYSSSVCISYCARGRYHSIARAHRRANPPFLHLSSRYAQENLRLFRFYASNFCIFMHLCTKRLLIRHP